MATHAEQNQDISTPIEQWLFTKIHHFWPVQPRTPIDGNGSIATNMNHYLNHSNSELIYIYIYILKHQKSWPSSYLLIVNHFINHFINNSPLNPITPSPSTSPLSKASGLFPEVCCENCLVYKKQGHPDVVCAIPRRLEMAQEKGLLKLGPARGSVADVVGLVIFSYFHSTVVHCELWMVDFENGKSIDGWYPLGKLRVCDRT